MTLTLAMHASDFIAKWRSADLTERAAAHSHFRDLCDVLGEETPTDADPKGEWYAFEKGASKRLVETSKSMPWTSLPRLRFSMTPICSW